MLKKLVEKQYQAARIAVAAIGVILIVGGIWISHYKPRPAQNSTPQAETQDGSAQKRSQREVDKYSVPIGTPRYITIPSLGIPKTRIMHVGTDKNYQIMSPANVNDTAWYDQSALPGKAGESFINGHYYGVFHNLSQLKNGDQIIIELGGGKKLTFTVQKTKVYPYDKVDMQEVLTPLNTKVPGLSLMTCDGALIKDKQTLSERFTVFASLK